MLKGIPKILSPELFMHLIWKTVLNGSRKISIFLRERHLTELHIKIVREEIIITFIQDMNGEKWKTMISA